MSMNLAIGFAQVGALKDISILRDQITGNSRGCAFAVFEDQEHAEAAIQRLDKKQTLPGANQPIEVRNSICTKPVDVYTFHFLGCRSPPKMVKYSTFPIRAR